MFERHLSFSETLRVPLSGGKFKLTTTGTLISESGEVLPQKRDRDGDLSVKLNWIDGCRDYKVSNLVAHTFKPTRLPYDLWLNLRVLFVDGNRDNFHPSNLVWKFPIGFMENKHEGFAYIPMFTRYLINRQGVVFDRFNGKLITAEKCKGYYRFTLMPDIGPRAALPRHRALCLTFKDYPVEVDSRYVNHKNGIKGSDDLDNLEWVTSSENRQHAINNNLALVNKPVIVSALDGTMLEEYPSIMKACQQYKLNPSKMGRALVNVDEAVIIGDRMFSLKYRRHAVVGNPNRCPILMRDMRTGIVTEYESIVSGAGKLGVSKHAIAGRIDSYMSIIYPDLLQFKRKSDPTPWNIPTDLDKASLESIWAKIVLMRNLRTGEVLEFPTQRELSKYLNVCEATIFGWVNTPDQKIFRTGNGDYIQVKLKSDSSDWRKVNDPEEEYAKNLSSRRVLVKDVRSGNVREFATGADCAREHNLLTSTLHWRLKSKGSKVYPPGLQFKYKDEPSDFKVVCKVRKTLMAVPLLTERSVEHSPNCG